MIKRRQGVHGPEIGAIGLGCMDMSDIYTGNHDNRESVATFVPRSKPASASSTPATSTGWGTTSFSSGRPSGIVGTRLRVRNPVRFATPKATGAGS